MTRRTRGGVAPVFVLRRKRDVRTFQRSMPVMTHTQRKARTVVVVGAIIGGIVTIGWLFGPSGTVWGVEFSPDRFSHRSFRYYQWCGIPITPKKTVEWRSNIDQYIHENGFAPSVDTENPRWHFVKGFAPWQRGWIGPAKVMCQAVGCYSNRDCWLKWSKAHPDLARIVWPQVVQWARNEQYAEISLLFRSSGLEDAASPEEVDELIRFVSEAAGK